MPVCAIKQVLSYPVCPFFCQATATGRAETAIAAEMNCSDLSTVRALIDAITLAWVVAEEHFLYFFQLVLAKQSFIFMQEVIYYVTCKEKYFGVKS